MRTRAAHFSLHFEVLKMGGEMRPHFFKHFKMRGEIRPHLFKDLKMGGEMRSTSSHLFMNLPRNAQHEFAFVQGPLLPPANRKMHSTKLGQPWFHYVVVIARTWLRVQIRMCARILNMLWSAVLLGAQALLIATFLHVLQFYTFSPHLCPSFSI